MARDIKINLDTSKKLYVVKDCNQNDDLKLEANIFENGKKKDLTNTSIVIQALKEDNTYIIQNTEISKTGNKIIAELIKDFTRIGGKTKIEIVLVEEGKQNTTFDFDLSIRKSVIDGATESKDIVTIIETLTSKIVEAGTVKDITEELISNGNAVTKGELEEVNNKITRENLSSIGMLDTNKIVNDLVTGGVSNLLSAEQGKVLDGKNTTVDNRVTTLDTKVDDLKAELKRDLVPKTAIINNLTSGGITNVLSAEQGKVLNTNINTQKSRVDDYFGTTIVLSEYKNVTDWGAKLNSLMTENKPYTIVCEANKEYIFNTTLKIKDKIKIVGNDSVWRYMGTSQNFIVFEEADWQVEGSIIEDLVIWCNLKSVGAYQNKYCFTIQGMHICIKFYNLKIYNFGYVWLIKNTDIKSSGSTHRTFGHSIVECNAWGFITCVDSQGNSEQMLIQHCWFDDGKREGSSQNACIKVTDATSFWIRDNVIQNCDIGVLFKGVRSGEITGNHFENMIDSSVFFLPNSVYENRNTTIMGNYLVGHKGCIRFSLSSTGAKTIHTTIINNCFGFLGTDALANITSSSIDAQSNTVMINNSKIDGARDWVTSNITTLKEFQ